MALSSGKTDKCDKDGRSSWRNGHLTYQVALQEGCGRREEERQRKKECVKDSRMDRATPGVGRGGLGLGCLLLPPNREGMVYRCSLCPTR
jgi:hypothetical protein